MVFILFKWVHRIRKDKEKVWRFRHAFHLLHSMQSGSTKAWWGSRGFGEMAAGVVER